MKRLTMIFKGDIDLGPLIPLAAQAIEFKVETLPDPPKDQAIQRTFAGRKGRVIGETAQKAIMRHYFAGGSFGKATAEKWLTEKGYSSHTASPALSGLKKDNYIKQTAPQKYEWIAPMMGLD